MTRECNASMAISYSDIMDSFCPSRRSVNEREIFLGTVNSQLLRAQHLEQCFLD